MSEYIVMSNKGQFWTGSHWSLEYPDAMVYYFRKEAGQASEKAIRTLLWALGERVLVWRDYGFDGARVVNEVLAPALVRR